MCRYGTRRCLLLLLAIPAFLLLARNGVGRHRAALLCRVSAYTLVVLALAGVALSARLPTDRLSVVAAVDRSESIDAEGRQWQQRYLDQVAAALAPGDELGVVVFGKDARVARPPGRPETADLEAAVGVGHGDGHRERAADGHGALSA